MKLYGFPPSPNTWKVRAVAAHLGIPLEIGIRRPDEATHGCIPRDQPERAHADIG